MSRMLCAKLRTLAGCLEPAIKHENQVSSVKIASSLFRK